MTVEEKKRIFQYQTCPPPPLPQRTPYTFLTCLSLTSRINIITFLQLWTLKHREVKSHAQDYITNKVLEPASSLAKSPHPALLFFPIFNNTFHSHPISGNFHILILLRQVFCLEHGSLTHLKDTLSSLIISAHYPSPKFNTKK